MLLQGRTQSQVDTPILHGASVQERHLPTTGSLPHFPQPTRQLALPFPDGIDNEGSNDLPDLLDHLDPEAVLHFPEQRPTTPLRSGAIAGGVIGFAIMAAIILIFALYNRRRTRLDLDTEKGTISPIDTGGEVQRRYNHSSPSTPVPTAAFIQAPPNESHQSFSPASVFLSGRRNIRAEDETHVAVDRSMREVPSPPGEEQRSVANLESLAQHVEEAFVAQGAETPGAQITNHSNENPSAHSSEPENLLEGVLGPQALNWLVERVATRLEERRQRWEDPDGAGAGSRESVWSSPPPSYRPGHDSVTHSDVLGQ